MFLLCLFITGCTAKTEEKEETTEEKYLHEAEERSLEIASLYAPIYAKAEKVQDIEDSTHIVLSQEDIDKIENILIEKDYSVVNSDSIYPSYLVHGERIRTLEEKVSKGQEVKEEIIFMTESGGFYHYTFFALDGKLYCTLLCMEWDENNQPVVTESSFRPVLDWYISEKGNFYFQIYPDNSHFEKYICIPLQPVDKKLYDWNKACILPVGYVGNNLFLCDWQEGDFGTLRFNDIFEICYYMKTGEYFHEVVYGELEPIDIPAKLFEETILPYFSISLSEFREKSLYNTEKNTYPWQELFSENIVHFPWVEPMVEEARENSDGTVTLVVDVMCTDYGTDRLFTHEVTIRPLSDGAFQYVGNGITFVGEHGLPPDYPRLAAFLENANDEGQ